MDKNNNKILDESWTKHRFEIFFFLSGLRYISSLLIYFIILSSTIS